MLARLQRTIVLVVILLSLTAGATVAAAGGGPWATLAAVGALSAGYAAVLGLEFALMHRINRSDATAPRARPLQVVRAWWHEVHAGPRVFGWRQPFCSLRWRDCTAIADDARGRPGVLFVHGFVCNRGLWNRWMAALAARHVPYHAVDLEPVFGSIDDYVPRVEAGIAALESLTGCAPIVVAHSMGGLALRRWWAEAGNKARVAHAYTLGTPHHGTWLARFALSANGRQMQRDSAWLRQLAAREPPERPRAFTCFYSHCDNIVFPASTAMLPGADNRHLPGVAHVEMVDRPQPLQALLDRLDRLKRLHSGERPDRDDGDGR